MEICAYCQIGITDNGSIIHLLSRKESGYIIDWAMSTQIYSFFNNYLATNLCKHTM